MTLKYESEILFDLMKRDGDDAPSDVLPYESELKEKYLNQVVGAYPKLQDYRPEWLNYNLYKHLPADFPVETVSNVTGASFQNVVPYAYKSAILKGSTKYRDIDTGEFLETFEDGKNLELVSVKMPVLTTVGKNLNTGKLALGKIEDNGEINHDVISMCHNPDYIKVMPNTEYSIKWIQEINNMRVFFYDYKRQFIGKLNSVITPNGGTFITPSNCKYIRFHLAVADDGWQNYEVAIHRGNKIPTSYEPYKSNILSTPEEVALKGIGDVKDTLNCNTGEMVKRLTEFTLTGNENLLLSSWTNNLTNCIRVDLGNATVGGTDNNLVICNHFKTEVANQQKDYEYVSTNSNGNVSFSILRSKLETEDVNGVKKYFKKLYDGGTPVMFIGKAKQEVIKTVDLTCSNEQGQMVDFMPLEGTMNVVTSSDTIQPLLDMEVPVEAITQNLNSFTSMEE